MSQPPQPPQRTSSLTFSSDQKRKREDAIYKVKQAQKSCDTIKSWDSAEYWQNRKIEAEGELEIAHIEQDALQNGFHNLENKERHEREREYLRRREKLNEASKSASRKVARYQAKAAVTSTNTVSDLVSCRASYLELILSMLTRTSRSGQSAFNGALMDAYGAKKVGSVQHVWSAVGEWLPKANAKASHIFPLSLGQPTMTYIFGPDTENDINSARNGLFLPPVVEEALDAHQLVIVPAESGKWKFMVLDRGGLWNTKVLGSAGGTFAQLHNTQLVFLDGRDIRPRARFFYFNYILAMLKISRRPAKERAGISKHMAEFTGPKLTKVWATGGGYMRDNMIRAFVEGIGHDNPSGPGSQVTLDPSDLLEHAQPDLSDEAEALVRSIQATEIDSDDEDGE